MLTAKERKKIRDRVIKGLMRDRYSADGNEAYEIAQKMFTPCQLGALHRQARQTVSALEELEFMRDW